MENKKYGIWILLMVILVSCNVQKPFYNKRETDWNSKKLPDEVPLKYSVYLVGGIGFDKDSSNEILSMLQNQTNKADTNHTIVFLSDHFYKSGIPEENDKNKKKVEKKINAQLDYLKNDRGRIYFIPGDENVKANGKRQVSELTKAYVEDRLGRKNVFLPGDDCPGSDEITLTDDLILVPLNTPWWLQDREDKNADCDIKNEGEWINALKDVVDNNQRKNILVVGHHPLLDAGNYGGHFSPRQHIFPLTDLYPGLYIPFPIVGSLYPLLRAGIGTKNDFAYPRYQSLRRNLLAAIKDYNNVVYASGHEKNLQYFKSEKQDFIVTGSKGKSTGWVGKRHGASFTYANNGFVKLNYLQNGEVWMEIYVPDKTKKEGTVVFRKRLKDNVYGKPNDSTTVDETTPIIDSIIFIAADKNLEAGKFQRIFLGSHYRKAWTTPVIIPVIDLRTEKGGLEIIKKGGGFQTKSLRVRNPAGEEFTLRSVVKYPERVLGPKMLHTLAADIVKDQASSSQPYAPLVVSDLSKTAGILYSNSKIVYIPKDKKLAEYRKDFANTLALFEERADGQIAPCANFGYAKEFISSSTLLDNLHNDNANMVDEYLFLKSRLFDMWINDWDRHENQWRWGVIKCDSVSDVRCKLLKAKDSYYLPIPKDRDQAFARFDGILPSMAGRKWLIRKFQDFKDDIRDVPGLNFNARNIDHALLTELSREDWRRVADELKLLLTDEKIEQGVNQFPDTIFKLDGPRIIRTLKSRRDKLSSFADKYYDYLAQYVDVLGSDKKEIFEVNRLDNKSTSVKVYDSKNGEKGRLLYDRTFNTAETKEIRLYGLGEEDVFNITGSVHRGILVRVIGGDGKDSITDASHVSGWRKKTRVYDNKNKNFLNLGSEAKDLTNAYKSVNDYDFYANNYDLLAPSAFFGYNPDDGIFVGGGVLIKDQGFRKKPYSNYQRIVANVALLEYSSFNFSYIGDFNNVIGKWGINIDASILAPKSTTNFFGLGNDVERSDVPDFYYRMRYDAAAVFPGFKNHLNKYNSIKIGPVLKYVRIRETPDRFISSPEAEPYIQDFSPRYIGGGKVEYEFQNIDDSVLTFRGLKWITAITSESEFSHSSIYSTNFESQLCLYIPMGNRSTIAFRAGGATRVGDFEFYQANTLGGQNIKRDNGNLRGYLRGRYAGRSCAYFNTDFRLKLFSFHTYLVPIDLGVLGFYDQGRVWVDNEKSNTWHSGYGGGLWIDPLGLAIINFTYAISREEKIFSVNLGFLF